MTLHVASDLDLPDDMATQKLAILATTGAGKSNTAVVLAEQMYDAGIPWVAVDPKGDWWGVRAGRDGKKGGGLEVPVFGGEHGDIPLEPTKGKMVANLIAEKRLTCVLDVSMFDVRQQMFRFLTDFADTLLRRNKQPLHIFAEEADDYIPQTGSRTGNLADCLGAWQRLIKRGRYRGIGATLISQRSAALNKDALNMADTLIAMRVTAPLDRKAVSEWIVAQALVMVVERPDGFYIEWTDGSRVFSGPHPNRKEADKRLTQVGPELVDSLPALNDGEGWVWSPHKLKLMQRVQFNRRRTFDSGDTPEIGADREPARLADIDLDAIKEAMAESVQRAAAEDPRLLQARIRELERELKRQPTPTVETITETVVERVEITPAWVAPLLHDLLGTADQQIDLMHRARATMADLSDRLAERVESAGTGSRYDAAERVPASASPTSTAVGVFSPKVPPVPRTSPAAIVHDMVGQIGAKSGAMRMLVAAAQFPAGLTKSQLATQAKMKKTGGSYTTYLSRLRTAGLITVQGDTVQITDRGLDVAGISDIRALVGDELIESWQERLGRDNGCRRMFDLLVAIHPGSYSKEALAERAEVERSGGSFGTYLSRLRSNGLIVVEGDDVRASETLFM